MSIRMGSSWPGRKPGTRHWVSYTPGWLGLWWLGKGLATPFYLMAWLIVISLAGSVWVCAEMCVIIASLIGLVWAPPGQVRLVNLSWGLVGFERG